MSRRNGPIEPWAYEQWRNKKQQSDNSIENRLDKSESSPDPSRPWYKQTSTRSIPVTMASVDENDTKGPGFEEIVDFITTGKPVPGNIRQIPNKLNTDPPSLSSCPAPPKKP